MRNLFQEKFFLNLIKFLLGICLTFCLFIFSGTSIAKAQLEVDIDDSGSKFTRSLESLRDLDYQTWQLVVYKNNMETTRPILRIVGYPGSLRIDHPTPLKVQSGIRVWELEDITLLNDFLAGDKRQAAAEFELTKLLHDLNNNRPLRLSLLGGFTELPVPPYLVEEWRDLDRERIEQ